MPSVVLRSLLGVLLLAALGGCSLFRKVHHPYRLPTPKPSPEYIAQQKEKKAAEKLRADKDKEANTLAKQKKKAGGDNPEDAATDVSLPSNNDEGVTSSTEAIKSSVYPERSTVRYDKHELMKKPKLLRRRRHKYHKGFHPIESIRNFFKYGFHAKPNYSIDHRAVKKEPSENALPDESIPTPAPDVEPTEAEPKEARKPKKSAPKSKQARKKAEPEPEPEAAPEPKPKRDKKAPKPDKAPRQEVVPEPAAEPIPDEPKPKRDKKQPKQKAPKPDKAPRQDFIPTPDNKP